MALLQWNEHLCKEADEWGWNSLHYVVKQGLTDLVFNMLRRNKSLAYDQAGSENEWTTAFHIAASEGHEAIIHELLIHCPDCWDMVNSNGQNALHVAILNDREMLVNALLKYRFCYDRLVDEADNEGNTPLHLLAAYGNHVPQFILYHPSANKMTFNKENQTPLDVNARLGQRCDFEVKRRTENSIKIQPQKMRKDDDEAKAKREKLKMEKILKSTEIQVVVATLIMTVAFAAGFTLPGGLDSDDGPNKGMSILLKKTAFRVFVISDVLAFTCAAAAIYIYSTMANSDVVAGEINVRLLRVLWMNYNTASTLQGFAMAAVAVAFVTAMYSTLENSLALAVTVSVIGCVSFPIFFSINITWNSIPGIFVKTLDN